MRTAQFDRLLRVQDLKANRVHAEHGRESSLTMQDIAHRTEQETFSMRVLTVVALVFLPPTFVAVSCCTGKVCLNS
jgi:hypothetical protein